MPETNPIKITKKRRVYWLVDHVSEQHRKLNVFLNAHGHSVRFFSNVNMLADALSQQRVGIIVIDDQGPSDVVEANITQIMSMPDAQGARLVLSVTESHEKISAMAACSAFRDLIPLDLNERAWFTRFVFATARGVTKISEPAPQVTLNHLATIGLPARIAWIGSSRMLIEARIHPSIGTTFSLSGKFVEALGLKSLSVHVEECRKTDLLYRFSDAVVVSWTAPSGQRERAEQILNRLRQTDFGPRCKVFLAVQDQALRKEFVNELDSLRFELNIALQKKGIVDEPKYFSPRIVFIEDKLCIGPNEELFTQMLDNLAPDVPVVVLGNRASLKELQQLDPLRKISGLQSLPSKLTELIFSKYLPPHLRKSPNADSDACHITSDHPFSMVHLSMSARLTRVHPDAVQLAIPVKIPAFGVCKIDTPMLKKAIGYAPYAKVVNSGDKESLEDTKYTYVTNTVLSDVTMQAKRNLGAAIAKYVTRQLCQEDASTERKVAVEQTRIAVNAPSHTPIPIAKKPKRTTTGEIKPRQEASANKNDDPISDHYNPIVEVAESVADSITEAADSIKRTLRNSTFRLTLIYIALLTFSFAVLYGIVTVLAPQWEKSGGVYTDSLKKFAPQKFERGR